MTNAAIAIDIAWVLGAIWALAFVEVKSDIKKVGLIFVSVIVLTVLQMVARME